MQKRLTIALALTALLSVLLVGAGVLVMAQRGASSQAEQDVTRRLQAVAALRNEVDGLQQLDQTRRALRLERLEVVVVSDEGNVTTPGPGRRNQSATIINLDSEQIETLDSNEIVLLAEDGSVSGLVAIGTNDNQRAALLANQRISAVSSRAIGWFFVSSALVVVLAVIAATWLASRLIKPVNEIKAATQAISDGDLSVRTKIDGNDELTDLGRSVNQMAQDLERSKALDRQFLMSISHDLRTPLTSIGGYAEAIADGTAKDPKAAAAVIQSNSGRLEMLVKDLLDLAKLDANQFNLNITKFDAAKTAERAGAEAQRRAEARNLNLSVEAPNSCFAYGDSGRVSQALDNLVSNALKFAAGEVKIRCQQDHDTVTLSVIDDGPGFAEKDLPHVFERLYRGSAQPKEAENSSGLGLAIVKELATAMGGTVNVENNANAGACLTLLLPTNPKAEL